MVAGTEFSNVRFHGDDARAAQVYEGADALTPEDVAETVSGWRRCPSASTSTSSS